jgi:hypothetical protein
MGNNARLAAAPQSFLDEDSPAVSGDATMSSYASSSSEEPDAPGT